MSKISGASASRRRVNAHVDLLEAPPGILLKPVFTRGGFRNDRSAGETSRRQFDFV